MSLPDSDRLSLKTTELFFEKSIGTDQWIIALESGRKELQIQSVINMTSFHSISSICSSHFHSNFIVLAIGVTTLFCSTLIEKVGLIFEKSIGTDQWITALESERKELQTQSVISMTSFRSIFSFCVRSFQSNFIVLVIGVTTLFWSTFIELSGSIFEKSIETDQWITTLESEK